MTCSRCRAVMYLNGEGKPGNHKRGVCSDGFEVKLNNVKYDGDKTCSSEKGALWPQPASIFSKNQKLYSLDPPAFLNTVRTINEQAVIENNLGSLSMECEAFADAQRPH